MSAPELPVSVWFPRAPERWFSIRLHARSRAPGISPFPVSAPELRFSVCSRTCSRALHFSLVRVCAPGLRFSVWTCACSRSPGFSPVPVSSLEFWFSGWSHACSRAHGLSLLSSDCWSPSLASSPVQVDAASQLRSAAAPSPFSLSSNNSARIHGSLLRISILSAGDVCL